MKSHDYREIIRDHKCSFCPEWRLGFVSWHHLCCVGNRGTGKKAPDYFTIPVCKKCHAKCHNYTISREEQKEALIKLWFEILTNVYGEYEAFSILGKEYWESL